jgi:hypothetical protein
MAKDKGPVCDIVESYAVLEETGNQTVEINKVAWNGRPPKIDIRRWDHGKEGGPQALKGVTLTDEACDRLVIELLNLGFGDKKEIAKAYNERKKK